MANDEVVIDLQNYKDRVGSRVVPGRYRVRVDDAEMDQTQAGAPMINVWLVVTEGEFEGATVIDRLLPSHPKALFRVVGFMQALGMQTPKRRIKLNISQFVGRTLEVDIEDGDPYNGRVKSEIRGYYRVEKKAAADIDDIPDAQDIAESPEDDRTQQSPKPLPPEDAPVPEAPEGDEFAPIDLENLDL